MKKNIHWTFNFIFWGVGQSTNLRSQVNIYNLITFHIISRVFTQTKISWIGDDGYVREHLNSWISNDMQYHQSK